MTVEGIDREELERLAAQGALVTIPASLLLALLVRIEQLEEKVASLESNSRNSSKPPSSDRHNPNRPGKGSPRGGRKGKKKRKPGGQEGHEGKTLQQVADPDRTVEHLLDRRAGRCGHCQGGLHGAQRAGFERRQVFDLPEKISVEVTEHRAEVCTCRSCGKKVKAAFPEGVVAPVQYGERIQAMVIYLHTYQLLPCERLGEFFGDVFGCPLSPGTVCASLKKAGARAGPVHDAIRAAIIQALFIHCDETGLSLSGKICWLHTASTPRLVYLHVDKHRGQVALRAIGILEDYDGWVIHDFLSAYYTIEGLRHVLCNAHLLRDLICILEVHGQAWAADMIALLLEAKRLKEREAQGGRRVGEKTLDRLQERYLEILAAGFALNPEPGRRPGQRGRLKRGKPLNVLNRLAERCGEIMAFLLYDGIPFDNNEAERDLRMMKVKLKISGCFRNLGHARAFAILRSIIASAKKQSINVFEILSLTLKDPREAQRLLLGT